VKSGAQTRLLAIVLAVFTLAALGLAIGNFLQESDYSPATDGASWTEATGGLRAYLVPPDTPAYRAGVRPGDILTSVNDVPTPRLASLEREIYANGVWSKVRYSLLRRTDSATKLVDVPVVIYLEPTDRTDWQVERLIALVYLAIGLRPNRRTFMSSVWSRSSCTRSSTRGFSTASTSRF
jgi:two-component system NtrC family sensor kinase